MHTFVMIHQFARVWFRRFAEYRGTLPLQVLSNAVHYLAEMFIIWVLIDRFERIGSWTGIEVVLLFAMDWLAYGLANFFVRFSFRSMEWDIQRGEFDEFLIRPMKPGLYYMLKRLEFYDLNFIIVNLAVLVFVFRRIGITFTFINVVWTATIVIGAALIHASLIMFGSVAAFWLIRTRSLSQFVVRETNEFNLYPLSIYPRYLQILLTFVIPWGFVNFYPAQYFLEKQDLLFFHPVVQYLTPIVGLVLLGAAILFWKRGLARYQSTGT